MSQACVIVAYCNRTRGGNALTRTRQKPKKTETAKTNVGDKGEKRQVAPLGIELNLIDSTEKEPGGVGGKREGVGGEGREGLGLEAVGARPISPEPAAAVEQTGVKPGGLAKNQVY